MKNFFTHTLFCTHSLSEHYAALSQLPGFVLLETSDKARGRYDIISAFPYDVLQMDADDGEKAFAQLEKKLPLRDSVIDLPFQGGAIGFFSYDLGASLHNIQPARQCVLDNIPGLFMHFYDWAIIVDHEKNVITLFAADTQKRTQEQVQWVLEVWNTVSESKPISNITFDTLITQEAYQQSFNTIQHYLQKGRCYQVNYTQPFIANCQTEPFSIYQKVIRNNPVPFGAYMNLENSAIISFSPERFLCMNDGLLFTSPIKGTAKSSQCQNQDEKIKNALQQCPKNRAENVMIVDLLRNDLGQIAKPGSVKVSALCEIQTFRGLHHLVSTIEAECLDDIHPVQAFKACFPGGSITGTPKREAMMVIQEEEPFARGIYCGSIGYFSVHGRFDSNIAIRTMVSQNEKLHLAAGGAIVLDSVWENEYQECFIKLAAIVNELAGR